MRRLSLRLSPILMASLILATPLFAAEATRTCAWRSRPLAVHLWWKIWPEACGSSWEPAGRWLRSPRSTRNPRPGGQDAIQAGDR
jgi:hypothetical protein